MKKYSKCHDWFPGSCGQVVRQYAWLERDLAGVDRARTPWVVLYGHRPMYCTNDDRWATISAP